MRTILAALLSASLLAACAAPGRSADDATAPADRGGSRTVTLDFTPGDAAAAAAGEHAATAEGGSGTVTVRGAAAAPTPCHTLRGEAAEAAGELVLRVAVSPDPDAMCAQVIASLGYTAVLRGVPAGEHVLRVVHTYPGSGWEEHEALSTRVTVR